MNISITIIEDQRKEKELLMNALQQWEKQRNVTLQIEYFCSGENYFASHPTDESILYILDIQLREMDGIEIAKQMRARGYEGTILFLTSFREYVFDGYDHPTYPYWTNDRGIATMQDSRTSMSLCIPRGLLISLRIGLEADKHHPHAP